MPKITASYETTELLTATLAENNCFTASYEAMNSYQLHTKLAEITAPYEAIKLLQAMYEAIKLLTAILTENDSI